MAEEGTVRPEHTFRADTVTVTWCCNDGGGEWTVTPDDYAPDRRTGATDRRKVSRPDGRGRRRR